jgi:hypothetical protein
VWTCVITVLARRPWESVYSTTSPLAKVGREGGREGAAPSGLAAPALPDRFKSPKAASMDRVWRGAGGGAREGGEKRTIPGGRGGAREGVRADGGGGGVRGGWRGWGDACGEWWGRLTPEGGGAGRPEEGGGIGG